MEKQETIIRTCDNCASYDHEAGNCSSGVMPRIACFNWKPGYEPREPQYLKPYTCPLCGTKADIERAYHHNGADFWRFKCQQCGCEFKQWTSIEDLEPTSLELDGHDHPLGGDAPAPNPADLSGLVEEYQDIAAEHGDCACPDDEAVVGMLVAGHDWTKDGAEALVELATQYGHSILCNACALAIALDIEDGEKGL